MRIRTISLYVEDQDKALTFYRDALGLAVTQDVAYGPEIRWLTVSAPDDSSGLELLLEKAGDKNGSSAFQKALYDSASPAISIEVDNLETVHQQLVAKGVEFASGPEAKPYGGTDAVAKDGCGNLINLHQAQS